MLIRYPTLMIVFGILAHGRAEYPSGYQGYGTFCYKVVSSVGDFPIPEQSTARKRCQADGADLASINSKDENDFIGDMIISKSPPVAIHGLVLCAVLGCLGCGYLTGSALHISTGSLENQTTPRGVRTVLSCPKIVSVGLIICVLIWQHVVSARLLKTNQTQSKWTAQLDMDQRTNDDKF